MGILGAKSFCYDIFWGIFRMPKLMCEYFQLGSNPQHNPSLFSHYIFIKDLVLVVFPWFFGFLHHTQIACHDLVSLWQNIPNPILTVPHKGTPIISNIFFHSKWVYDINIRCIDHFHSRIVPPINTQWERSFLYCCIRKGTPIIINIFYNTFMVGGYII